MNLRVFPRSRPSSPVLHAGCSRPFHRKSVRPGTEVRWDLQDRSFAIAIGPARVLKFAPNDNGAWARLAQAQFGAGDFRLAKPCRLAAHRPQDRGQHDEYRGDLALAEGRRSGRPRGVDQSGREEGSARAFTPKIARRNRPTHSGRKRPPPGLAECKDTKTAAAPINRAICYRHLHSWDAALADLHPRGSARAGRSTR